MYSVKKWCAGYNQLIGNNFWVFWKKLSSFTTYMYICYGDILIGQGTNSNYMYMYLVEST